MTEIWLTEAYYREYRQRKGTLFHDSEKGELFEMTQTLQKNWPRCATDRNAAPEVGMNAGLYYAKCDFSKSKAIFRIAFGHEAIFGNLQRLVALTCRTKQELAHGSETGTKAWYRHMATIGRARWADYQRGFIAAWRIY